MEEKKKTKAQIEKEIRDAIVFVPRDKKNYTSVFFTDKGVRLECTLDYCVISTGYHRHVFSAYGVDGVSRPYLYVKRLIEIAHQTDCAVIFEDGSRGYSFAKLYDILKDAAGKEDTFLIVHYMQMWLQNIYTPLFMLGESELSHFYVFLDYLCFLSSHSIILDNSGKDITNNQFISRFTKLIKELTDGMTERVVMHADTDEESARREVSRAERLTDAENVLVNVSMHEDENQVAEGVQ